VLENNIHVFTTPKSRVGEVLVDGIIGEKRRARKKNDKKRKLDSQI
jgi:hypothetical protein